MRNPFVYGKVVADENFADRKAEKEELIRDLSDRENIFLISPRRYGKTSLIFNVLDYLRVEKGFITIYVDLYKATSLQKFLELYSRQIALAAESKLERAISFIREVLPGVRPKITLDYKGNPSIGIDYIPNKNDALQLLEKVFDLPRKISSRQGKTVVVVFDEFQEIMNFDGDTIEKSIRATIQHHSAVGYVFAGSKKHIIEDMFYNATRAFYKIGRAMYLDKIPRKEFSDFIETKFRKTGFVLAEGVVDRILDIVDDYPYNAQFLCHKLWDINLLSRKIKVPDIQDAVEEILFAETPYYTTVWDGITLSQRNLLSAIVDLGGKSIFSQDFINAAGLGSSATVQRSAELLMKKGVIEKNNNVYEITDVFFKEWIRKETS